MKGQFFLATVFALAIIFFAGISSMISPEGVSFRETTSLALLFDNVKEEYPRAANLGLNESDPVRILMNFTEFVEGKVRERGADFSLMFVLTRNESNNLNVTVGNYLGYGMDVILNVSGDVESIYVPDRGTNSEIFTNPPESFTLGISFNTTERNLLLEKRKANLYLILEMMRGENVIKEEVIS
jgi:hypothetical protein